MAKSLLSAALHRFVYTDNTSLQGTDVETAYTRYCDDWSQPVICAAFWSGLGSGAVSIITKSPYAMAITGVAFLVVTCVGYARATTERVYKKVVHDLNSTEGRFIEYGTRADSISKQLGEKITALKELHEKLAITEKNLEKNQEDRRALQESFDKLKAQLPGITIAVDNALQGADRFRNVSEQLGKQIANLTNKRIEIKSQSDAMAGRKEEMLIALREFQRRCDDIADRYDDFITANESLKTQVATISADKKALETAVQELRTELTAVKTSNVTLTDLVASKTKNIEKLTKAVADYKLESTKTKALLARLEGEAVAVHITD